MASRPAVAGNLVLVGGMDGLLYALSAAMAGENPRYRRGCSADGDPRKLAGCAIGQHAFQEVVIVGPTRGAPGVFPFRGAFRIYQLLWKHPMGGSVRASPAIAHGIIYLGSYNHFCALDTNLRPTRVDYQLPKAESFLACTPESPSSAVKNNRM